jgi:hypothetical protein
VGERKKLQTEHEIQIFDCGYAIVLKKQLAQVVDRLQVVDSRDATPAEVNALEGRQGTRDAARVVASGGCRNAGNLAQQTHGDTRRC